MACFKVVLLKFTLLLLMPLNGHCLEVPDFALRQCEPIRIDMCRGIGYNETSMPNLVGNELQTEVEYTLQSFAPLIEYVCSTQLKLFLCAAYVPMCTPKVGVPIGPCRSLCDSVRTRCHPVLQGFGFPWPPALDCNRFPKENNHETMCMEGPGEAHSPEGGNEQDNYYAGMPAGKPPTQECPSLSKLHRSGRCAPLCDADILFGEHEKHLAEVWVATWTYAALGLAAIATLCLILSEDTRASSKWASMLTPLVWCHNMVAVGWTVRFVSGRTATACGYDPQYPNVSLLLVDGLSNASCAATFLLRYYFGMAACAWWAILCLGWHRDVRRNSPDTHGHMALATSTYANAANSKRSVKRPQQVTQSNLACFAAWGLPGFQTAAIIVARLVDADELLGACFVGNQSDVGLQIFVATPLFCYWIFGTMNLISGYLVHRRNKELLQHTNSPNLQQQLHAAKQTNSGIGTFLVIYCTPCTLLLLAVIYEFVNIDVWLNVPPYQMAPLWPFLLRAFMELMLGIICCAWVLGPKISTMYKRQLTPRTTINKQPTLTQHNQCVLPASSRSSNIAYSTASYHTVRQPIIATTTTPQPQHNRQHHHQHHPHHQQQQQQQHLAQQQHVKQQAMSLHQMSNYARSSVKCAPPAHATPAYGKQHYNSYKHAQQQYKLYGNETIL